MLLFDFLIKMKKQKKIFNTFLTFHVESYKNSVDNFLKYLFGC